MKNKTIDLHTGSSSLPLNPQCKIGSESVLRRPHPLARVSLILAAHKPILNGLALERVIVPHSVLIQLCRFGFCWGARNDLTSICHGYNLQSAILPIIHTTVLQLFILNFIQFRLATTLRTFIRLIRTGTGN